MNWPLAREVAHKLAQMRGWLEQERAGAVRLRGVDWFAWATAGASNSQGYTAECACAEVLVTRDGAYLLTDEADAAYLREVAVQGVWTWQVSPWMQPQLCELREHFVQHAAGGAPVLSDRPGMHERNLPAALRAERLVLLAAEQQRYRHVGQLTAHAASDALRMAQPGWTERELAAACVRALYLRGLQPLQMLAMGADRQPHYRRASASSALLGARAVLAVSARRHGLCASLSRQVRFASHIDGAASSAAPVAPAAASASIPDAIGDAIRDSTRVSPGDGLSLSSSSSLSDDDAALLALEAVALNACEAGHALSMVYHALDSAYAYAGQPDAILRHRQGGICGYLAPEVMAGAHTEITLKRGMAVAFHPSLPCGMVEDTFLLGDDQLLNLTHDPSWPSTMVQGRQRPLTLVLC